MLGRKEIFKEISPADFFYRNRDLAGFTNPARSLYAAIREFIENSLDACDLYQILPDIYVRLTKEKSNTYRLRVEDNGPGIPYKMVPLAFAKVLFGSKFVLRQTRGMFGLGGTMAILYGQITTNESTYITSSVGDRKIHFYELRIDILRNEPIILQHKIFDNPERWHGIVLEICLEGDYMKAMPKVLEYLRQTAIANPHANITFIDLFGRMYLFERVLEKSPPPPKETLPHPHGVDVETLRRLIISTNCRDMLRFITTHFHRVGRVAARKFLESVGIPLNKKPVNLKDDEIVRIVEGMKVFKRFRSPDANCLSTLGSDFIKAGIEREFNPDFIVVGTQNPSSYSGHPFKIEVAIAYGGKIPKRTGGLLYRFANKIPLLYDEASDVSWKIIHTMINWKNYGVDLNEDPIAIFVYLYSTRIPYKTVGKEYIADRPEIEREIISAMRSVCRKLRSYLLEKQKAERKEKRLGLYSKYLSRIAKYSTELARKEGEPDIAPLLKRIEKAH